MEIVQPKTTPTLSRLKRIVTQGISIGVLHYRKLQFIRDSLFSSGEVIENHDRFVCLVPGKNAILYRSDGSKKIADNALVALTLMIAESKPDEKEMMTKVKEGHPLLVQATT